MIRVHGRQTVFLLLCSGMALTLACASSTDPGVPETPTASAAPNELVVANAWVDRDGDESALSAYFVMQNRGASNRALIAARSTLCGRVSLRRVVVEDGMWASTELASLDVPAGGAVAFVPRGLFLQLDCGGRLTGARSVPITLEFAGGESVVFEAELRSP